MKEKKFENPKLLHHLKGIKKKLEDKIKKKNHMVTTSHF